MDFVDSLRFGYGKNLLDHSPTESFRVRVLGPKRALKSPLEEFILNAKTISKNLKTPRLCLSGGMDSEVMALSFLAAQVNFEAVIIRFNADLNLHDIQHAIDFCEQHKIKYNFFELDIIHFFENQKYQPIIEKHKCPSAELASQLYAYSQLPDDLVVAGEAFRAFVGPEKVEFRPLSQLEATTIRYFAAEKKNSVANFHLMSSEAAWSVLKQSLKNPAPLVNDDHEEDFYRRKLDFYRACGFALTDRLSRTQKLHGFEKVKKYFDTQLYPDSNYQKKYRDTVKKIVPMSRAIEISFDHKNQFIKEIFQL
jgi:hypothetical protein